MWHRIDTGVDNLLYQHCSIDRQHDVYFNGCDQRSRVRFHRKGLI